LPKSTSAERAARVAELKQQRNRSTKSTTKTLIDKAQALIAAKDIEKARLAVKGAISQVDRAVRKKTLHANTAARRKSNLMKNLNKAFGTQSLPATAKKTAKKPAKRSAAKKTAKE